MIYENQALISISPGKKKDRTNSLKRRKHNRPYLETSKCLGNDFHWACLRIEILLREQTLSSTLNLNPKSSHSVNPQLSQTAILSSLISRQFLALFNDTDG